MAWSSGALLVLLLPALILAPLLQGGRLLVHAHDDEATHGHVLLHGEGDGRLSHDHGHEPSVEAPSSDAPTAEPTDEHGDAPGGLVIAFPLLHALRGELQTFGLGHAVLGAQALAEEARLFGAPRVTRQGVERPPGWIRVPRERSGVASLLVRSHALRV